MTKIEISVLIPTRGRPEKCLEALHSLKPLGLHTEVIIGLDDDDETGQAIRDAVEDMIRVRAVTSPRHTTLARLVNSLYERAKGNIILYFPDDYLMATKDWAAIIVDAVAKLPNRAGVPYLRDPSHPGFATFPVLTREAITANGDCVPPWFPYWFIDTWWDEVGDLLGIKPELPVDVIAPGGRGLTQNIRDIHFWAELFHVTRPVRGQTARALVDIAYGNEGAEREACLARFPQLGQALFQKTEHLLTPDFAKAWEAKIDGEVSPRYVEAKAEAEKYRASFPDAPKQLRVGICMPTTGMVHARTVAALMALMTSAGASGIATLSLTLEGSMVTKQRNDIVRLALKHECDYILFIDSDMIFPPDALMRLLSHKKDIVGATYCKRVPPYETLGRLVGAQPSPEEFAKGGLKEAELMPGGMMLIKTDVFKKIPFIWYWETYRWKGSTGVEVLQDYLRNNFASVPSAEVLASIDGTALADWLNKDWEVEGSFDWEYFSEDLNFCRRAIREGYKIWCDLSLTFEMRHIGVLEVTCSAPGKTTQQLAFEAKASFGGDAKTPAEAAE